jgi:NitT/TauT family transport system substrate-binding protein
LLVDNGYIERHVYTLQTIREVPYAKWREYNPEDTVRFFALRLQEPG